MAEVTSNDPDVKRVIESLETLLSKIQDRSVARAAEAYMQRCKEKGIWAHEDDVYRIVTRVGDARVGEGEEFRLHAQGAANAFLEAVRMFVIFGYDPDAASIVVAEAWNEAGGEDSISSQLSNLEYTCEEQGLDDAGKKHASRYLLGLTNTLVAQTSDSPYFAKMGPRVAFDLLSDLYRSVSAVLREGVSLTTTIAGAVAVREAKKAEQAAAAEQAPRVEPPQELDPMGVVAGIPDNAG